MKNHQLLKLVSYTLLLIIFTSFYSCKKTKPKESVPEENGIKTDGKYFEINFNPQTIELNKVEYVNAEFKSATANFVRQLKRGENSFYLDKNDLQDGNWEVIVTIYAPFDASSKRKYILKKNITTNTTNLINGPIIKLNNEWKPFVIIGGQAAGIELIFSELQENPLFEITNFSTKQYDYVYFERQTFDPTNRTIDGDSWDSIGALPEKLINITDLAAYAERMKNKTWDKCDVFLQVIAQNTGDDKTILYNYANRYKD